MQQTDKPVAIIPGESDGEKIDIKDVSKGPVRKRGPRSEEKGAVSKLSKKNATDGGIVKKGKDEEANADASKSPSAYRDYCNLTEDEICDPASLIYASASAKESPFPVKLHRILSNPEYQDLIAWLPHGRSWRVLKPKAFEEKVVPLFFRHCRYSSFMRQVNGWGFQRVHQGPDVNSYYHELFLRGMPHLSLKMRRPSAKEMKARTVELVRQDAPDFYKLSEKSPLPEYDFVKTSGTKKEMNDTDNGNQDAGESNTNTETPSMTMANASSVDQQQDQQKSQVQPQANVFPQLLGLAALQEKQKAAAQQLLASPTAQAPNAPDATNVLAAFLGGSVSNAMTPQQQVLNVQPLAVQSAQQIGNAALLQILAAQQEQQRQQQQQAQQQQLALLQSSGLLGQAAGNAAGANSNAEELTKLRTALASSQLQNQIMAAALLSKPQP